tara:strand:+ start:294 stop:533 length:240 start_codon:yes stop_codon:yes gene_type:complete
MKTIFNNEEFNLTFSIDLAASTSVLEAKLMDFLLCEGEEAWMDREMWATNSSVDVLDREIIFWGGNGCLGFERVDVKSI